MSDKEMSEAWRIMMYQAIIAACFAFVTFLTCAGIRIYMRKNAKKHMLGEH